MVAQTSRSHMGGELRSLLAFRIVIQAITNPIIDGSGSATVPIFPGGLILDRTVTAITVLEAGLLDGGFLAPHLGMAELLAVAALDLAP